MIELPIDNVFVVLLVLWRAGIEHYSHQQCDPWQSGGEGQAIRSAQSLEMLNLCDHANTAKVAELSRISQLNSRTARLPEQIPRRLERAYRGLRRHGELDPARVTRASQDHGRRHSEQRGRRERPPRSSRPRRILRWVCPGSAPGS